MLRLVFNTMGNKLVHNIYYDESIQAVVADWKGYATSAQFREGSELMLDYVTKHGCHKALNNVKELILISKEDQDWVNRTFIPKASGLGLKIVALVQPDSYFNKVAVESISYKIDKETIMVNFFETVDEAKRWLADL
jgi:hypothetical protein